MGFGFRGWQDSDNKPKLSEMRFFWGWLSVFFMVFQLRASDDWPRAELTDLALKEWIHEFAFPEGNDRPITSFRTQNRTNALLIVHKGKIVFEEYQKGFDPHSRHLTWSISKSITGILIGLAIQEGVLKKESLVEEFYPELKGSGLKVQHLLHWESGFDWNEDYEYSPIHSRVIQMLFSAGRGDMAQFVVNRGFRNPPGSRHFYSSGDTIVLGGILKKLWGKNQYFPWTKLFNPLGMNDVTFERDSSGTYLGSSFLYTSASNLARIGWMLASKGVWNEKRILDPDWISWATQVAPSFKEAEASLKNRWLFPGAQFWVNRKDPTSGLERTWPSIPEGAYFAKGHWGQIMGVFPEDELVVVRFADDRTFQFDYETFFSKILSGLKAKSL